MKAFKFASPTSVDDAVALLSDTWGETEILAGGTDLITSLKQGLVEPNLVVSLDKVKGLDGISASGGKLRIGSRVTLAALEENADVRKHFPSIVAAVRGVGADQITNRGTMGGDLCQRPRCWYYRQGLGLLAMHEGKSLVTDGENQYHAIFGNDGPAKFVNASSLAPALIALDAEVTVAGPNGKKRTIGAADFFRTPSSESERETTLAPNEVITEVAIPTAGKKNGLYEIRPRRGLDWPLVAAAVAFDVSGGSAQNAKVVLGHVAPTPWNSAAAARALNGKSVNESAAAAAGAAATQGATPLSKNGYKVPQVKIAVKRAVMAATA